MFKADQGPGSIGEVYDQLMVEQKNMWLYMEARVLFEV